MRAFNWLGTTGFLIVIISANAQSVLRGHVYDPSGAVIPDVSLTLISRDQIKEGKSGPAGEFEFNNLPRGRYAIKAYREGFKTQILRELDPVNETAKPLSISLKVLPAGNCGKNLKRNRKRLDRKSTRLNSSHVEISYAVFCLKKKKKKNKQQ